MTVEIWSDVMCPFCYIGKRRFENALKQFSHKNDIQIEWKSFQLDPDMKTNSSQNINEYLAERKGWTLDYAKNINAQVTDMAKELGLHYDFDKAIVVNSFNAHRVSHLAKEHGLSDAMEEVLFKAYFTEGKNIDDKATLIRLGTTIGIDASEIEDVLNSDRYANNVEHDVAVAQQIGIRGVPFFVFDRKYAVSGAQSTEVFLDVLNKAQENKQIQTSENKDTTCSVDDGCY